MDFYFRDPDGKVTGPHFRDWMLNRISTGTAEGASFAAIPDGRAPVDADFQEATIENLRAIPHTRQRTTSQSTSSPAGGFLRVLGALIGIGGVIIGAMGAVSEGVFGQPEFSVPLFAAAAIEAAFYGGLLWAAGTVIGQLDDLKRQTLTS